MTFSPYTKVPTKRENPSRKNMGHMLWCWSTPKQLISWVKFKCKNQFHGRFQYFCSDEWSRLQVKPVWTTGYSRKEITDIQPSNNSSEEEIPFSKNSWTICHSFSKMVSEILSSRAKMILWRQNIKPWNEMGHRRDHIFFLSVWGRPLSWILVIIISAYICKY